MRNDVDQVIFLTEIGFPPKGAMPMFYDNQAAIYITNNSVFHEKTKHIEVDCHFVRNTVLDGLIITPFTTSSTQLADVFTKTVSVTQYKSFCNKLDMVDLYAPA